MPLTAPLGLDDFRARLDALGRPRRYIVAVSGGPDSMALARLAALDEGAEVLAVTVDHGLRDGSRGEAEQTASWCRASGLDHALLSWQGEKPAAGKQEAARRARYWLLADLAERRSFPAILTAHTADDQAETVFMRLARGSGPAGLSGMAPSILIAAGPGAPVPLLRPLLDMSRERLQATVESLAQPFVHDPSNDDPAFERVRIRALLGALEEQGLLTRAALFKAAARARAATARIEAADFHEFEARGGVLHPEGYVSLARWRDAPSSLIARMLRAVGGGEHAPSDEEAAAALSVAAASGGATLGGAMMREKGGRLFALREPAALTGRAGVPPIAPAELRPGARLLWDGRFGVENRGDKTCMVRLAGPTAAAADAPPETAITFPVVVSADREAVAAVRVQSLLEERFRGGIVRFSAP